MNIDEQINEAPIRLRGSDIKNARPYAKAVFAFALQQKQLGQWSQILSFLAAIASDTTIQDFLTNPNTLIEQAAKLFTEFGGEMLDSYGKNFINLLATNRKLTLLPAIANLFETMRIAEQQELKVEVVSITPLTEQQKIKLLDALKKMFNAKIIAQYREDKSLIGGIVVKIGDRVIDGSIFGKLESLRNKI